MINPLVAVGAPLSSARRLIENLAACPKTIATKPVPIADGGTSNSGIDMTPNIQLIPAAIDGSGSLVSSSAEVSPRDRSLRLGVTLLMAARVGGVLLL